MQQETISQDSLENRITYLETSNSQLKKLTAFMGIIIFLLCVLIISIIAIER